MDHKKTCIEYNDRYDFQSIFKSYIMSLAAYHSDIEDRRSLVAFGEFF